MVKQFLYSVGYGWWAPTNQNFRMRFAYAKQLGALNLIINRGSDYRRNPRCNNLVPQLFHQLARSNRLNLCPTLHLFPRPPSLFVSKSSTLKPAGDDGITWNGRIRMVARPEQTEMPNRGTHAAPDAVSLDGRRFGVG